jgi:hypothetical protein
MNSELNDLILVWSLSATDAYTLERCDWYSVDSFQLHCSVAQFIRDQLDLVYSQFSEWLNLAEFPDAVEQLRKDEIGLFLKAAGAPDGSDRCGIEHYDCFAGLRAVILDRLEKGTPEQMKMAAELFNWTIECGLFPSETNARAEIRLGATAEVAPFIVQRILERTYAASRLECYAPEVLRTPFMQRFLPLVPMLMILKEGLEADEGIEKCISLRILRWVIDMYKVEIEKEEAGQ